MPEDPPIRENFEIHFPVMELKTEKDPAGGLRIAYQKMFPFVSLRDLARDILDRSVEGDKQKEEDEYSDLVAVVLLLAASLECFVNDMLIVHAREAYGQEYKQVAEGFLGGNFRSRFFRLIPIVSRSRKKLDHGHHSVGLLLQLIKTRNLIAHTMEHYVENPPWDGTKDQIQGKSLTFEGCGRYAGALDNFFAAVLSGTHVLKGRKPWDHELVVDGDPDLHNKEDGE